MSESFTWLDHVIFAMVPLGIVAGITSAIRVQGPHIVRAFIGRARENKALVEYELMSSTSHEVGEAFNGQGIVRVLGRPRVAEFVIFPKQYDDAEEFFARQAQEVPDDKEPDHLGVADREEDDSDMGCGAGCLRCWSSSDSANLRAFALDSRFQKRVDDESSLDNYAGSSEGPNMMSFEDDDSSIHMATLYLADTDDDFQRRDGSAEMDSEPEAKPEKHEHCGIHSLESMARANDPDLMRFGG